MPIDPETKKILDNRLAAGEIGVDEYKKILGMITDGAQKTPLSPQNVLPITPELLASPTDEKPEPTGQDEMSSSPSQFVSSPSQTTSKSTQDKEDWGGVWAISIAIIFVVVALMMGNCGEPASPPAHDDKELETHPAWLIGRWEEDDDGKIHGWVPRFMDFDRDGTVQTGGAFSDGEVGTWKYQVEGDFITMKTEVVMPSGNKYPATFYYIRTKEGSIAMATKSGRIDGEDRYYKK